MSRKVSPWQVFTEECPEVVKAYQELMKRVNNGIIDKKTESLILVGIYSAIREGGALRHFVDEAMKAGASKEEVKVAALLPFSMGVSCAELGLPIILEVISKQE